MLVNGSDLELRDAVLVDFPGLGRAPRDLPGNDRPGRGSSLGSERGQAEVPGDQGHEGPDPAPLLAELRQSLGEPARESRRAQAGRLDRQAGGRAVVRAGGRPPSRADGRRGPPAERQPAVSRGPTVQPAGIRGERPVPPPEPSQAHADGRPVGRPGTRGGAGQSVPRAIGTVRVISRRMSGCHPVDVARSAAAGGTRGPRETRRAEEPFMIEVINFTKRYGEFVAVDDLSFTIGKGEIFGFIGPNGAGKSTTIRFLATLLRPTSGEGRVDGHSVVADPMAVRRVIGFMPDNFGVYDGMKVWEFLDFFAVAYEIPRAYRKKIIGEVLELLDLTHKRDDYVNGLSKGMKQRLCLAKTLVHDPPVLILDEPASGLDPRARLEMKALLNELRGMGKTILISSHILSELADFCTSIGIIERGKLLAAGQHPGDPAADPLAPRPQGPRARRRRPTAPRRSSATTRRSARSRRYDHTVTAEFEGEDEDMARLLGRLIGAGVVGPVVRRGAASASKRSS